MRSLVFLIFLILIGESCFAQKSDVTFYLTPSSSIKGEAEFNLEIGSLKRENTSWLFSTGIRSGEVNKSNQFNKASALFIDNIDGDQLFKFSVEAQYRKYLNTKAKKGRQNKAYFGSGLGIAQSLVSYEVDVIGSSSQSSSDSQIFRTSIQRYSIHGVMGVKFNTKKRVVFDTFFGLKLNYSYSSTDAPTPLKDFSAGVFGLSYNCLLYTSDAADD